MAAVDDTKVQDLLCKTGTTFELHTTYSINNQLQDTTNYRGSFQIRPYPGSPVLLYEGNVVNGHLSFSGADGGIHLIIPYTVTRDFVFDRAYYDLFLRIGSRVRRPLKGMFLIDQSVNTGIIP